MKVRATKQFESIIDGAIGRPRKEGEEWEVDQERAFHLVEHGVAVIVEEKAEVIEEEKPKKRGRKKKD